MDTEREQSSTLASVWEAYLDWAAFSRKKKPQLFFWRRLVLGLGLAGAVFETLSTYDILPPIGEINPVGFVGAAALAVAAVFSRQVLGGDPERVWVRSRSVAEALQSEAYKFCTRVPPYDRDDREQELKEQRGKIVEAMRDVPLIPDPAKRAEKPAPPEGMSVTTYLETRIASQIDLSDGFYWKSARDLERRVGRFKWAVVTFAAGSAILGVFGAAGISQVAIWVAVLTTVSASVAAYFQANRYEYLLLSYTATARRLKELSEELRRVPESSLGERNRLILACEEAISVENQAWMAKWLQKPDGEGLNQA